MKEKVGYQPEEPTKAPPEVNDWRVQEMYNMAPDAIMDELLGLSEEILEAKNLWEEARFELRQAQERLKLMEAQVLQAAMDDGNDQVKGKNAEERKRRADIFLADHPTVKQLAFEIKPLESLEAAARVAMEERLDRSKNLHQWARMFEAQVKLLSTVRMPEPVGMRAQLLYFVGEGSTPPLMVGAKSEDHAERTRQRAVEGGYMEVAEAAYVHAMEVYRRSQTPVEILHIGEEPEPDGARFAKADEIVGAIAATVGEAAIDELFPPDIEIPPKKEADVLKAAVERYQDIGEKADESPGPSL